MRGSPRLLIYASLWVTFFSCSSKQDTLFEPLSSSRTNITFKNELAEHKLFNILYYLYYYNGGGVATGDINNDGLVDIYFTANNKGGNELYLNKGNFEFENITEKAGVEGSSDWCTGVTMADVNGDGLLDIYVSSVNNKHGLKGHNQLFINNGNLSFTDKSAEYGLNFSGLTTQTAFFDMDNDGDLDCYILNQSDHPHANVTDTSRRKQYDPLSGDVLFRNDLKTTGKFTDVSKAAGIYQSKLGYGLGIAIADLNNDGYQDIYIGNDFHENDYYYVNNGNGSFRESGADAFRHYSRFSMGNDVADYNNDGQLDLITVDMLPDEEKILKTYGSDENEDIYKLKLQQNGYQYQYSKNCLQRNNGNGESFSETALLSGVAATDWSWAPLFADFDNDGNKDLFISSGIVKRPVDLDYIRFVSDLDMKKGRQTTDKFDDEAISKMPDGSSHPYLYRGSGGIHFEDVSNDWGTGKMKGYFNGASYADLDNDGDLDLVINSLGDKAVILQNKNAGQHHLSLSFRGNTDNRFGVGAKAYVFTKKGLQYQQMMPTRGFQSSSDVRLHFGLGKDSLVDSILVVWPGQRSQVFRNIKSDTALIVHQEAAKDSFIHDTWFPAPQNLLASSGESTWKHQENNFSDFNVQYLIPHCLSTRGPKLAVADVNKDGLDDIYACAASGDAGALLLQQRNGGFAMLNSTAFLPDAKNEDVDAIFFDANGDTYPDLYVVSGGNQFRGKDSALLDRLYINDGKGGFSKSMHALPALFANKSCVTPADVDRDGDTDLFVGTLSDVKAYGVPQTSYLLLNDGKGFFSVASAQQLPVQNIGLVTTASFSDLNLDGWPDLVVAGEWMPITVFTNRNGQFTKSVLPKSTGWWQTIQIDDVNGDTFPDILAGNWGWNNKFWSGKNGPVRLYVKDFDRNGQTDQLLSYTLNDQEFPFLAKDEMERALPVLRKHYLLYEEYAGVVMKDVFYGFVDTVQPLVAERLGSAVCFGDGKGGFTLTDLPAALQLAPIFSFTKLPSNRNGENLFMSGGNFFDVIPYEGRYDAQPLALFGISGNNRISHYHQPELLKLNDQVRDVKWIKTNGGRALVVGRNNASLLFYRQEIDSP